MKFFHLLFVVLVTSSFCSSTLPKWYESPVNNSDQYIYGVGASTTLQEATFTALEDMSSRLLVSVDTKMNIETSIDNQTGYKKNSLKSLEVDSFKHSFLNYVIEKQKVVDGIFYVLVKVDKQKQLEYLLDSFKKEDILFIQQYKEFQKENILVQIKKSEQIIALCEEQINLLKSLEVFDSNFDTLNAIQKYRQYLTDIDNINKNITFCVKTHDTKGIFKKQMMRLLTKNDYIVVQDTCPVWIVLDSQIELSEYKNWHIAKVQIDLMINVNGKNYTTTTLHSKGRSSVSEQSAVKKAAMQFYKELENIGLENILFNQNI